MVRPTPEQMSLLVGLEHLNFRFADAWNRNRVLKRAAHSFLKSFGAAWVYYCTRNLAEFHGLEFLKQLAPDRGVVLATNHRSFFDMYVISSVLLRSTRWIERMYFPVRSEYWYDRPDGLIVNGIMSAWAMYPPVIRDAKRRAFNEYSVDYMCEVAQEPGTLIGIHPEGTRNKTDNPYVLTKIHPGIGEIVHRSRAIVIPAFVMGLDNDLPKQVRGNFNGTGDRIIIVFGKPVDLTEFYAQPLKLRTAMGIAHRVADEITALGQIERSIRQGTMADNVSRT